MTPLLAALVKSNMRLDLMNGIGRPELASVFSCMSTKSVVFLQDESTALIVAARKGDRNTVVRLVKNGANILAEDNVSRPFVVPNATFHRERSAFISVNV